MRQRPDGDLTDIEATIICERDSHKGIIIGKQGSMLKKIGTEARGDIEKLLEGPGQPEALGQGAEDWRDSDILMKITGMIKRI